MTYYAVRKFIKKSNRWDDVSYYDESWSFRGAANRFATKAEAQRYLELYQRRINSKLNFYGKAKLKLRLRVFKVEVVS